MRRPLHRTARISAVLAVAAPLAVVAGAAPAHAATRVAIEPAIRSETFTGWGTSLAWSANYTGDWSNREELADLLFSHNGDDESLGLNIVRYNIGGGDNPANAGALRPGADVPSFRPDPDAGYDWDADPRQRWWLRAAVDRIPEERFAADAVAYSAPYWMTQSGRSTGNTSGNLDNLLPGYEDEFADYLADVVQHFSDEEDIDFRVLSPLNEPATNYWNVNGRQEGMHVSPGAKQKALLDATHAALQERDLSTGLSAVDETGIDLSISDFRALRDAGFDMGLVDQINTHSYSGGDRTTLRQLAVGSADKRLQMSEVTIGTGAHDQQSIEASLAFVKHLTTDLRELQPEEWVYWQALESEAESIAGNGNWGLVHYTSDGSEEYTVTRKFHAMRQYTNFIRPGSSFIWNSSSKTVTSLNADADELTIVSYNDSASPASMNYDLSEFDKVGSKATVHRTSADEERESVDRLKVRGDELQAELPAKSISTFVIPVTTSGEAVVANGDFETGRTGQNPPGWLTWGGDAYGTHLAADYTQSGGAEDGHHEGVHYSGSRYHVYTYQRLDVPDGTYTLRAQVRSNGGLEVARMLARSGGQESAVAIPGNEQWSEVVLADIDVTDGALEFGFESKSPGGRWVAFDNVELEKQ